MRHNFVSLNLLRSALVALAGLSAAASLAGPINYATRSVGIRAGVVITDSNLFNGFSANSTPFIWYNLDRNRLVKPAGWNFYNPHAPSSVTQAMIKRWTALGGTAPLALFAPLTKATAPYWEVPLSQATDTSINDYDVLILPVYNTLSLNATERSRLQRFIDHGGVLWIDVTAGVVTDDANGAPLSFSVPNATNQVASIVNPTSQIFTYPFTLNSLPESTYASSLGAVNLNADGYGALLNVLGSVPDEFGQYVACASDGPGGNPTVMTSRVGNGAVVVTARGVAAYLNQATVLGNINTNIGFTAFDTTPDANANQVARFAINAITLVNGSAQDSQGPRKSGGSPIDITSPLIREWSDETKGGPAPTATPITYKGLVIVSALVGGGQSRLYAYAAVPGSDLDFDGNPDDGIPDFSLGKSRDLIWQSVLLNGPISAAAAIEIPNAAPGVPGDMIAVVDQRGNLVTFNAFPLVNGSFPTNVDNPVVMSYAPPVNSTYGWKGQAPFGPTVHDGLIYVTDNVDNGLGSPTGRIWVVDPRNSQLATSGANGAWAVGGPPNGALQATSAGVTIGYIPIADNSGGADRVVYVPTAPQAIGAGGQTCGISSLWAGTKGERHGIQFDGSGNLAVPTRAQQNSRPLYLPGTAGFPPVPDPHGVHLTLLNANGDALTAAQTQTILTGGYGAEMVAGVSQLFFTLTANGANQINALGVVAVSVDYTLDWGVMNNAPTAMIRGSVQLPDDTNRQKSIIGNLALSPAGTLYAVEAEPTDLQGDGMFWALREQGQGSFIVVTRFDMYDSFTLSTPGATTVTNTNVPATFQDNDPTQGFASNFLAAPYFTNLVYESGPAVADGRVFVKVRGYKKGSSGIKVPCTLLLCFNAEPQLPSFTVPVLQSGFTIFQPDYNRSTDKTQPETFTQLSPGQYTYTQGVDHSNISLDSLATTQRQQLASTMNESLPIIIRQSGQPDLTIDPSTVGTWSPLQWYTVFYGLDPASPQVASLTPPFQTGPPVVTGNTVFLAGNSLIPYIFQGISPVGKNPIGMLIGYNAALTGASDSFAIPNSTQPNLNRPYFIQIAQISTNAGNYQAANPDLEWPQNATAKSFPEYLQRLYQTVLDGANLNNHPTCYGIAAGQGGLFAYSDIGVYGYKRANFTVADENRLAAFDPSGNALWTTDSSLVYGVGVVTTAGQDNPAITHPLVRPTRAYPIGASDYLVVDPGSNRLARIDASGREIRSIDSFVVDPNFQPDGYISGEPLTFNQPQDVLTFGDYQINGSSPFTNSQPIEYWRHYVVADTGNRRLVELVDRYAVDPTTRQPSTPIALGVLFYHSPANVSGKKGYDFNSVARVLQPGTGQNGVPAQYIYATSIGSTQPSRVGLGLDAPAQDQIPNGATLPFQARDSHNGNGGIMVFNGGSTQVINQVAIPQLAAGVLWNPTLGSYNLAPIPAHYKTLGGLSSVTMSYVFPDTVGAVSTLTIMFTDSTGIYEISLANNPITGSNVPVQDWVVDWMMPTEVYTQLRRDPASNLPNQNVFLNATELKSTYARRTSAGTVLLVNSYFGMDQDLNQTAFPGEIIELDGSFFDPTSTSNRGFSFNAPFLGFDSLSVVFQLPSVQGARGIVAPIFADRR